MSRATIVDRRLSASRLVGDPLGSPVDVVRWSLAVQSQDYPAAAWALAQRAGTTTGTATATDVDALFDRGDILRTHVLRPTWHFVLPADIRWLLALTAPRVRAAIAYQSRRTGLDGEVFARSKDVIALALAGGRHLTRPEIGMALRAAGIEADGLGLGLIVMHAELDAVICSGPRRGRRFTYGLLEERAPNSRSLDRDEALRELARRYVEGHGPVQARDLAWWSGLTRTDARRGIQLAADGMARETVGGTEFWSAAGATIPEHERPLVHLLPNFDEFVVAFADRGPTFAGTPLADAPSSEQLSNVVLLDGRAIGHWRRVIGRDSVTVATRLLVELDAAEHAALERAAERYGRFLGLPVILA